MLSIRDFWPGILLAWNTFGMRSLRGWELSSFAWCFLIGCRNVAQSEGIANV